MDWRMVSQMVAMWVALQIDELESKRDGSWVPKTVSYWVAELAVLLAVQLDYK